MSGYVPLDPGDYILCEKLLEVVGFTRSPAKTAIGGVNPLLSLLAPLLSASWLSRQVHLNNEAPTGTGGRTDLHEGSILRKAFSDELAASDITS